MLSHSHLALYILSLTAQQELLSMNDVSVDWALAKNPHLNHEIWQQLYSKYAEIGSAAPHDGSLPHNLLKALHQNPRSQEQLQLLMSNPDLKVGATAILHALPMASDQFILQLIHNPATPPEFAAAALASALSFTAPATATLLNKFIPSHLKDTLPELYNSAVIGAATLPTTTLTIALNLLATLQHHDDVDAKLSKALDIRPELLQALLTSEGISTALPIRLLTLSSAALSRHLTSDQGHFILTSLSPLTESGATGRIKITAATRLAKNPNLTPTTRILAVTQILSSPRFKNELLDSLDQSREREALTKLSDELHFLRQSGARPLTTPWQDAMGDPRVERALKEFALSTYPTLALAHYNQFPERYATNSDLSSELDSLGQGAWKIYLEAQDGWEGTQDQLLDLITTLTA